MTKKEIIGLLKTVGSATIAFGGLIDPEQVKLAREELIGKWEHAVKDYNKKQPALKQICMVVSDNQISAGSKFAFLPMFPKTGAVLARSKDYIVADVYCDYGDILPETFAETKMTWAFKTKAGSVVIISKDSVL